MSIEEDREDYVAACYEMGFTTQRVAEISRVEDDVIPDAHSGDIYVGDSEIEGQGIIAKRDFSAGDLICPLMSRFYRTIAGRYVNHAKNPTGDPVILSGTIWLSATRGIKAGEEITADYRAVRDTTHKVMAMDKDAIR